ncbi:hypothetical protein FJM01_01040 [Mycoplasma struthionis]|nr:hypothetical protein FJM01_01040 [Mycoplasma struthionis]
MLAVSVGNIHGEYPKNWKSLDFDLLNSINNEFKKPLVLHGASGLPFKQLYKAIDEFGVRKININTDLQIENAKALISFINSNNIIENKLYHPRKLYETSIKAMEDYLLNLFEKFKEFILQI